MQHKVTSDEIENFKLAMRIDIDDDDEYISGLLLTAKQYIQSAVSENSDLTDRQQFKFAVQVLAQFWYTKRDIDLVTMPYQVISMIQQLRGTV